MISYLKCFKFVLLLLKNLHICAIMMKIKTTEIPNRAKDLYIQLYCDKIGSTTSKIINNATQSWLSLSITKKRHFYETLSTKSVVKKAQLISKIKPYLRAKFPSNARKRQRKTVVDDQHHEDSDAESVPCSNPDISMLDQIEYDTASNQTILENNNYTDRSHVTTPPALESANDLRCGEDTIIGRETIPETSSPDPENTTLQEKEGESISELRRNEPEVNGSQRLQNSYLNVIDEDSDASLEDVLERESPNRQPTEPIVPTIKKGKDLFELINSRNGTTIKYESLTVREKRLHGLAVKKIKKAYVTNFKEYLESLTSRQLYDYYLKTFK